MKKLAAILLLSIFVFNLFGYKLWLNYMEHKANLHLEAAMDNNQFNSEELVSVKKSLNLPYYNNTKEFTRMDGEIEVNGTFYKYVKCRIYNDSLELLCLPDMQKTKLVQAKDDFFKITADIQKKTSEKNKSNPVNTLKKMLGDFVANESGWMDALCKTTALSYSSFNTDQQGDLHKRFVEQPPDTVTFIS
jgi:hypothetical protein